MRNTIGVRNARENNLKNIDLDIPRDQLIVVTGLSGSGKSSLAFETIYAEGQRRFLESLSTYSRKFVEQLKKPAVDFVHGLSPVISIEQKTTNKNPRSTVGTMTDLYDYLRILYATIGQPHCPYCNADTPMKTPHQITEHLLDLPEGTVVEVCAPVFKIYGEDYPYLFGEIRSKGYRRVYVDGDLLDISEESELDEAREYDLDVLIDTFVIKPGIDKAILVAVLNGLRVGEGFLRFNVRNKEKLGNDTARLTDGFACPQHRVTMGELKPYYFSFNESDSACPTCMGLGTYLKVHPSLLVPDPSRSIKGGAFIPEAFRYDKNVWNGMMMYSLAQHYGFDLDAPFESLPPHIVDVILYGTKGERFPFTPPSGVTKHENQVGKLFRFDGIINTIERHYKQYRRQQIAHTHMEHYLRRVMVEHTCPDCQGTKLKRQRLMVTLNGQNIHELGLLSIDELREFIGTLPHAGRQQEAGQQIAQEIITRLDLLLDIGLNYLNLGRRSMTLSGGESQRIRLSTQISSGLMGMLYVLDEPSIGLHPRDNRKMINTLKRLRDIGNTVIVVEHDEDTMRAADHIIELGPGPGAFGGHLVAQGTINEILDNPNSLTGQFLSKRKEIPLPTRRRKGNGSCLTIRGAHANNLKHVDVHFPLGLFLCITGVSGSGKSTLINDILYKKLYALFHDSRTLSGAHKALEGVEHLSDVINIDQSPIGRTPNSNPATYVGVYDYIRQLFASTDESKARGYTASRFSFNVKGGRCEECGGQGLITTHLQFMPDVETPCHTCKGARYNAETLEVKHKGKTIAEVLEMPIDEAVTFFADCPIVAHKLKVMDTLGLGYLRLGQSSTTISGGEAQRVKLAHELGKVKRGGCNLYILDEPTTGLHLADIQRLLDSLNKLVEAGNTVLVIEHHLDVIKSADYVIDLGPEGGHHGGQVVACGTPEEIARHPGSYTGQFLKHVLDNRAGLRHTA